MPSLRFILSNAVLFCGILSHLCKESVLDASPGVIHIFCPSPDGAATWVAKRVDVGDTAGVRRHFGFDIQLFTNDK
jgi:hypothetical protein